MEREEAHNAGSNLRAQLLRECIGMAKFAIGSGKAIPPAVATVIEAASPEPRPVGRKKASESQGASTEGTEEQNQNDAAEASSNQGSAESTEIRKLVAAHERLAQIVAPATPQAILLLRAESASSGYGIFLGPVPLVRHMMLAALLSLALFIGMALYPDVTGDISFRDADHFELLRNLLFLLAAAGLGASFEALFRMNRFIAETNYDPKFNASYWIRFTLGLIAGIILAQLVPIGEQGTGTDGGFLIDDGNDGSPGSGISRLAKPTLALLGGFSAVVVYRILNRLVTAVDSLVRGETREIVAARELAAKARLAEQTAQSKMETLSRLVALQQQISDGADSEQLKKKVAEILDDYLETDLSSEASPRQSGKAKPDPGKSE